VHAAVLKASILLGDLAVAGGIVALTNWLALIPFRRAREKHWTERARKLYPARVAAVSSIWVVPADLVFGQELLWPGATPHWLLAGFACWVGAMAGTYFFDHEVYPWITPQDWLHQALANWTLRFAWCLFFLVVIAAMPDVLDWRAWALSGALIAAYVVWAWGGLVWCCGRLRLLKPPSERLKRLVAEVSAKLNISSPRVWLLKSPAAAAFALPYSRDLFFSERLLSLHSDDEVASICAHELGHLGESKAALAGRFLGALAFLPWAFLKPLRHLLGEWVYAVALLGLTSFIFLRLAKRLSRRLETRADSIAQANEGQSGTYARALARLYEENLLPAVLPRRRHTHPDLYDRLLAVGVQPDYQRPEPPNPATYPGILLMLLFVILIMLRFIYKFG